MSKAQKRPTLKLIKGGVKEPEDLTIVLYKMLLGRLGLFLLLGTITFFGLVYFINI